MGTRYYKVTCTFNAPEHLTGLNQRFPFLLHPCITPLGTGSYGSVHKINTVSLNHKHYPAATFYNTFELPQLLIKYAQYEIPTASTDNDAPSKDQLNAGIVTIKRRVNNFYELHSVLRAASIPYRLDTTGCIHYSHIMPTLPGITLTRALVQARSNSEQYAFIIAALIALHQYHQGFNKAHLDPSSHNIIINTANDAPPQAALIDLDHSNRIGTAIQSIDAKKTLFSYWPHAFIQQHSSGVISTYHDLYMFVLFLYFEQPYNYLGHAHYTKTTRIRHMPALLDALTHRTPLDELIQQLNSIKNNPSTNSSHLPHTYPRLITQLHRLADQSHQLIWMLLNHPSRPSPNKQRQIENTIKDPVQSLTQTFVSMAYDPQFEHQTAFDQLYRQCTATNHCLQALLTLPQSILQQCHRVSLLTLVMNTRLHQLIHDEKYCPKNLETLLLKSVKIYNHCPDIVNAWMTQTTLNNWLIQHLASSKTHNTKIAYNLTLRQIKCYLRPLGLYTEQLNLVLLKQECRNWLANQQPTRHPQLFTLSSKRKKSATKTVTQIAVSRRQRQRRAPKKITAIESTALKTL